MLNIDKIAVTHRSEIQMLQDFVCFHMIIFFYISWLKSASKITNYRVQAVYMLHAEYIENNLI